MKHSFKVGDKVRIKPYDKVKDHRGISEFTWKPYAKKEFIIKFIGCFSVQFEEDGYFWSFEALEPVFDKHELIVFSKGPETVAVEKVNGKVVRKGVAKCSPHDEYKWEIGRNLALERLLEEYKPEEKPLYNGKVVCVRNSTANERIYKVGKIYQFENGYIYGENNVKKPDNPVHSFEEWKDFSFSEWIEIVE